MEDKDVRIFCEMAFKGLDYDSFTDRRVSPLAIGRKLGLDEKTVRVRVNKMEEDGFIKYYQAMLSLVLFNLNHINSYSFEAMNILTKHRGIDDLPGLPYIIDASDYFAQVISVSIADNIYDRMEHVIY